MFNALGRIRKEEGTLALWRGCMPTVLRASALNIAMMVSYDETKERMFAWRGPGYISIFYATLVSGVFTAFFSLPFDNVKTKIQ